MIDFNKPVQTRDGRKVRVICKDAKGTQPVVALVPEADGSEFAATFSLGGRYYHTSDHPLDLINVPERVERILCVDNMNSRLVQFAPGCVPSELYPTIRITYEDGKPVAVALEDCK